MNKNMSKLFVFAVIAMYMVVPAAFAEDVTASLGGDDVADLNDIAEDSDAEDASEAGITPDSPFYGLDVAMDNVGLMLTFNKAKKAEKKLQIANERLKEAKMMGLGNNLDAMEKAKIRHDEMLLSAEDDIDAIGTGDETEALKTNMKIKTMLQMHKQEVSDVEQELTLRVRGRLTAAQQENLDAFLGSMKGSLNSVDVKVQNREEKIKAVMKKTRNMSDAEIEDEFENYNMAAAGEHLGDKTENLISQADKAVLHAEDLIAKKEEAVKNVTYAKEQLEDAKLILAKAKAEYADGNIEDAVELAFKAKRLAIYAASGFSIEKLMNTPVKDNPDFNEMKERIMERKEVMIQEQRKVREQIEEHIGNLEDDFDSVSDDTLNDLDGNVTEDDSENGSDDVTGDDVNETSDDLDNGSDDENDTVSGNSSSDENVTLSGNSENTNANTV
ncbi:MAG: hypothetical protein KAS90_06735 [Candidatus Aenigmarchaeota archaeon]|nr:hypothetical protein [Candidatus Aenigmarchaeota archaeon]